MNPSIHSPLPWQRRLALLCVAAASLAASAEPASEKQVTTDSPVVQEIKAAGGSIRQMTSIPGAWEVRFHLRGRKLTDQGLALVTKLGRVGALNLRDTQITSAGLVYLKDLKDLRWLHLERTKITDRGTEHLAGLVNLEYLNLYGTGVTDATLARLTKLSKLRRLYVWQTKVTEAGIERLEKALPKLRVVRGVDLSKLPAYSATIYQPPKPKEDLTWRVFTDRAKVPKSETGINTQVFFKNESGKRIKIYWVSYGNELKLYGALEPGGMRQQNTYARNTWLITDEQDRPLGYFLVGEEIARAVVPPTKEAAASSKVKE